ncbi:CocE/NonD family hydrolase [Streptomyces sp. NPDC047315]|uniref:CocE/NonD family hydrolase n=1 Tax=Streptomyces sp. NPDC047315 TaxID=3155142 RepID=UPI0033EE4B19
MRTVLVPAPGSRLATDVHLPPARRAGRHPTVVIRTPYGRGSHTAEACAWAARGFAVVVQDVRGRHGSALPGAWRPYEHEAADGAATVRWVRERPWSDGRIVAVGASYAAYCALVTVTGDRATPAPPAAEAPDAVIAAVPALGTAEVARERSGVERLLGRAGWWAAHGDRTDSDPTALDVRLARAPELLAHLPVATLPERLGRPLPSWRGVWGARREDLVVARAATARVPLLAVGGTHDPFAADTLALWRRWGGPARLLVGPWGHALTADPGPGARQHIAVGEAYARWARAACDGTLRQGARGVVALAGTTRWYRADGAVPEGDARAYPFDDHGVRLLHGATFLADPERPVRSDDLRVDPDRTDRTLLVTEPLTRPLDLLGPASVRLRAEATTPCADWFVRLVALDSHGRAEPVAVGSARTARPSRNGAAVRVDLGFLARRLPVATRLRIEVAGHHFPAHARNPHTGEDPVTAVRLAPSRRTVHPGGSALLLPAARLGRADAVADPIEEMCT